MSFKIAILKICKTSVTLIMISFSIRSCKIEHLKNKSCKRLKLQSHEEEVILLITVDIFKDGKYFSLALFQDLKNHCSERNDHKN